MKHLFCGGMLALAATLTQGAFASYPSSCDESTLQSGSQLPMAPGMRMTNRTMQKAVLAPVVPVGTLSQEGDARLSEMSVMGAGGELVFQHWKIKDGTAGYTYWAVPNFVWTFGKDTELTLSVPLSYTDLRNERGDMTTIGTDLRLKQHIGDMFYVGGHVNAMYANTRSYAFDATRNHDDYYTIGMGPFAGVELSITEGITLSLGGLIDYGHSQDNFDSVVAGIGSSLGIQIVSGLAISPYVTYYNFLTRDGEPLSDDRDYFEVGIDLLGAIKDNWTFSFGIKDTVDYEYLKSWDFYIGTTFRF